MDFKIRKKTLKSSTRRLLALILCTLFFLQQTLLVQALAETTNITGIVSNATSGGGSYSIKPINISGKTGFRKYSDFSVGRGDVVNLEFTTDYNKFVNLVSNRITINGILNAVKGNSFYNSGHVVFVSPNGMVVGAKGVINVGALSVYTPGQTKFNDFSNALKEDLSSLQSDSQGEITINGRIYARNGVNLYGKNITIDGGAVIAGIDPTIANYNSILTTNTGAGNYADAEYLFNNLVKNNVVQGSAFTSKDGKIVIKAQDTSNIKFSSQTLSDFEVDLSGVADSVTKATSSSSITIKDAVLAASSMDISAESNSTYDVEAALVPGILTDIALNIDKVFDGTYSGWLGAKSTANINISNSKLASSGDINISTSANSTLSIPTAVGVDPASQQYIYSIGTSTESKINVEKSNIKSTGGDVNILATSTNDEEATFKATNNSTDIETQLDENTNLGKSDPDAKIILVSSALNATTSAVVDKDSTVEGQNVAVGAVNSSNNSVSVEASTEIGEEEATGGSSGSGSGSGSGGSAKTYATVVSLGGILNRSNVNTTAEVNGTVKANKDASAPDITGKVDIVAQNLYLTSNSATASSVGKAKTSKNKPSSTSTGVLAKVTSKINSLTGKNTTSTAQSSESIGGAMIINLSDVNATAKVGKTANITANKLNIQANTVDLTINNSTASVENAKYAPAVAIIVNKQNDATKAEIEDGDTLNAAVINVDDSLKVNATTQMPLNTAALSQYAETFQNITAPFNNASDFWNDKFLSNVVKYAQDLYEAYGDFNPADFSALQVVPGFFNNYAESNTDGTSFAVGGSVIYSEVNNSTKAHIGDRSTINAGRNISVNAANSIVYNNISGVIGDLIQMKKTKTGTAANGIGGSLVLSFNDHDAEATIGNNVKINSEKTSSATNLSLNAATNQFYLTIAAGGSQGTSTAIEGSVAVIESDGTTKTSIGDNCVIKANSLTLNSGSASIDYASQEEVLGIGYELSGMDDTTGFIDMEDSEKSISDKAQLITITGALAKQTSGSTTTASGTAVGASVNVAVMDRDVISSIGNNSTITLSDTLSVLSNTDNSFYDIAIAGAFAGGVSTKKTTTGSGATSGTTGGQSTSNQGGWIDRVTSILSAITGKTGGSGTSTDATNATSTVDSRTTTGTTANSLNTSTASNGSSTTSGSSTAASRLTSASNLNSTSTNSSTATNQLNLAAAGSINALVTDNNVSASVGNSKITTGNDIKVSATQSNSMINVSTGLAKASGVGAGAAINLALNLNSTSANIGNFTPNPADTTDYAEIKSGNNAIGINAQDSTRAINVAVGVGAATSSTNNKSSTSAAIGGSFNASALANSVNSYIGKNAKISNASTVGVNAKNSTAILNIAGGIAANTTGASSSSIGAGIAANINVFAQDTKAGVMDGAIISSSDALTVNANNKDNVVSIGVAGTVVTGGNSAYTFTGALGTDVLVNTTSAYINNSTVTSKGVSVTANNDIGNYNLAGAASFSSSQSSYSVGAGAIIEVIANNTTSGISGSTVTSTGNVDVKATQNETLKFLAFNGAISNSGSGFVVGLNGIINVLVSTIDSYISGSDIKNATDTNVISTYNSDIEGITSVNTLSTGTSAASLNLIANVVSNSIFSRVLNSDLNATGTLTVKSDADENINVIPAAFSVSASSGFSVAANIAANILVNTTSASISGKKATEGTVSSSGGVKVSASDDTTVKVRGGTVSLSGDSAAVGGSILLDVLVKNVSASIGDSTTVTSSGDIDVSASAINLFGPKDTVDPASVSTVISSLDKVASIGDWEMTFDLAGGNSAAVSGSVIAKVVFNNVNASIGSNSKVTGKSIDVLADNETYIRAIVGNITASGTAAIGGSFFINTLIGLTNASIGSGTTITTTGTPTASDTTAGDVNVKAISKEDVRTVMVTGEGSGTVAVNGSLNVNTIVNVTKATIDGATIDAKGDLGVIADEDNNISSLNLSVSGSGTVSVGVIGYVNTFADVIESSIKNSTSTKAGGNILVDANGSDSFGATMAVVSAAGTTGIAGLVLFNTIGSSVNSYISNSTVTSTNGSVTVSSDYDYNKTKYGSDDISAYLTLLSSGSDNYGSDDLIGNYIPIVTALNVTGSAYASVGITAITNTVVSSVNAYVTGSTVSSSTGLTIDANTDLVAYDAMASFAVAGIGAAVTVNGITNTLVNSTSAYLDKSIVSNGDVDVKATQNSNLNSIIVGASVVGVGGAVSGLFSTKVIASNVSSRITDSSIQNSNNVKVKSVSNNKVNNLSVAGAGSGIGGTVTGVTSTNVLAGTTEAYISGTNTDGTVISKGNTSVEADNYLKTFDLITAATVSGVGADVGINVATNVIVNGVNAYIKNAKLANNTSTSVKTISDIDLYDIVANCGVNLVGASVGGLILTNVVDDSINSYISSSTINSGSVSVTASQDTNLSGGATSINAGGISVAANVHAVTNVFEDDVNAYILNSTLSSNTGVTVTGTSNETIDFATLSGSAAGLGGIAGSVLTNIIGNRLNSYISGGNLSSSGAINVSANQTVTMNNLSGGISIGAVGVGARSIVNVLTNTANAYVDNANVSNSASMTVSATSTENIKNNNYVASGGGVSAGVGVLTNVIENTTHAYINAKNNTINTGALKVSANDNLTLQNIAGVASIAAAYSGAMSINVNIINNSVQSELLTSSSGSVNASSVDVTSDSTMNLDIATASAAAGITGLGLAGTIAVTSIGDRVNSTDSDYNSYIKSSSTTATDKSEANSSNSTAKSKLIVNANGTTYDYSGAGNTVNLDSASGTAKAGTVANINGNVTSTNAVNVKATNTVKGLGDDTFNVTNVAAAGGTVAAGASILVTDMKYKTTAEITGGTVKSTSAKDITVQATNTVNTETNAASAAAGGLAIGGNVAVFKNNATTTALVSNSKVQSAGAINILASSRDSILTRAISGTIGLGTGNFVAALSKTVNHTTANVKNSVINGGSSTTKAGNLNIKATNTSTLISEMESGSIGALSLSALVNLAQSNSITSAIIDGTSNIYTDNLNLISSTGGISAENIMYVGSLTYFGSGTITVSGADINSTFNSTIQDNSFVKTDGDISIKAGVNDSNYAQGGNVTSKVTAKAFSASAYLTASSTTLSAKANANTNITIGSDATVTAGDEINIYSALNRNAFINSVTGSLSSISISALTLDVEDNGTSQINVAGDLIANTINMSIKDTDTASAKMLSVAVALANASAVVSQAISNSNASITTSGSLNADNINISTSSERDAYIQNSSNNMALLNMGATSLSARSSGSSTVSVIGTVANKDNTGSASTLNTNITDTSNASNDAVSFAIGLLNGNYLNLSSYVNTNSTLTLGGNIKAATITANSLVNRTAVANSFAGSGGLCSFSGFNLTSQADGSMNTNLTGSISGNDNLTVNSTANNTVKTYLYSNSAALVALARGSVTNYVGSSNGYTPSTNSINFNGSNILTNKTISANARTNNTVYMTENASSTGFITVRGGRLSNYINSTNNMIFRNANITAKDISLNAMNYTVSPIGVKFTDGSSGFITSSGATIVSNINQTNDFNVYDSDNIYGTNTLTANMDNNTNYSQEVKSNHSGFSCYNAGNSSLNINNTNKLTINEYTSGYVKGGTVNIYQDVNNNLTSKCNVEAHHFAGQPSTKSTINLYNTNDIEVYSNLLADTLANISFMGESVNNLNQDAYVYAEAAIASADWAGGINYNNTNKINVVSSGKIASAKDVNILYTNGRESLNSRVAYDKCSRILFGIKIHKRGSSSRLSTSRTNSLNLDGSIEAGSNAHTTLAIKQDGTVDTINSTMDKGLYEKKSTTSSADSSLGQTEIDNLNVTLTNLENEKKALEEDKQANSEALTKVNQQITELVADINDYNEQIAAINYTSTTSNKIDLSTVKTYLSDILTSDLSGYSSLSDSNKAIVVNAVLVDLGDATTVDSSTIVSTLATLKSEEGLDLTASSNLTNNLISFKSNFGTTTSPNLTIPVVDGSGKTTSTTIGLQTYKKQTSTLYTYTYNTLDKDGNITGIATVTNSSSPYSGDTSTQKLVSSSTTPVYTTYLIHDDVTDTTALQNDCIKVAQDSYNSLNTELSNLSSMESGYASQISNLSNLIANYTEQRDSIVSKALLPENNGSYIFKDMNLSGGIITIRGLNSLTGSGKFILSQADLQIDNYSNYNLIFNNITIGGGKSGLNINGISYITPKADLFGNIDLVLSSSSTNNGQITINDWYDPSDPTLTTASEKMAGDILFKGAITNNLGGFNVFNDGGDILVGNSMVARAINLAATQGNVTIDAKGAAINISADSLISAGKDVDIDVDKGPLVINGSISAGNSTRSLTITNSMLSGATETKTVNGVTYKVINVKLTNKSAYLNSTNNIKALYNPLTNEILLFDTTASGGSVTLNAKTVSGAGKVSYSTNYGTITIDNQTNAKLIVNDIKNNYYAGTVSGISSGLSVTKKGVNSANTSLNSTGAIDVAGVISSGNSGIGTSGSGTLTVSSNSSVTVENSIDSSTSSQVETIDTTGTTNITGGNGVTVKGKITNRKGNTIITSNGSGALSIALAGLINNGSGNTSLISNGTGGINIAGAINNTVSGSTSITNLNTGSTGIVISGSATNNNGDLTVSNKGQNGIAISGMTTNDTGNTSISNEGGSAGGINISGKVENNSGKTAITNNGTGGISISGIVNNSAGSVDRDLEITNAIDTGIKLTTTGKVTNSGNGNTKVTSSGTGGITVENGGSVNNDTGNLTLTNNGVGNVAVAGSLNNTSGVLSLVNNNAGASKIEVSGTATNNNGDTVITNKGINGITVSGTIANNNGNINITNENGSAGGIIITSTGTVNNTGFGNVTITNNGTGGVKVDKVDLNTGRIMNQSGTLTLTNNGIGDINIFGNLTNAAGITAIENLNNGETGIMIGSTGTVINGNGLLKINNAGVKGITIVGATTNNLAGILTNNTEIINKTGSAGGINISGSVTNNGSGNTLITNNGKDGITITSTGNVKNGTGNLTLTNTGLGDTKIAGTLINITGNLTVSNKNTEASGIFVSGVVINNNGDLTISNNGQKGITISGITTNTTGNTGITNEVGSAGGINISGKVDNKSGKTAITNNGAGGITVSGTVNNSAGKSYRDIEITNAIDTGIKVTSTGKVANSGTGNTKVTSSGTGGITVENGGSVSNETGNLALLNTGVGDIAIAGHITNNTGITTIENANTGKSGVLIASTGFVTNNNGNTIIANKGASDTTKGIIISGNTFNRSGNTTVNNSNTGSSGINISDAGKVTNGNGSLNIVNDGQLGTTISGTTTNTTGNTNITNETGSSGGINISGSVTNKGSGNTLITNNGKDGITITSTGKVNNDTGNLTLTNTGLGDTTVVGSLGNKKGTLSVLNTNTESSGILISGSANNSGNLVVSNKGQNGIAISGMTTNITGNTSITNETEAAGGINISGKVENISGKTAITNNGAGGITVSGIVINRAGSNYKDIEITNTKDTGIKVTSFGIIANFGAGNTKITSSGTDGITVDKGGFISNGTGNLLLTNTGLGDTTIAGSLINNTGNTTIENTNTGKSGITITSTGTVTNKKGLLGISNAGTKGITIAGTITNNETGNSTYNTEITNKTGSAGGINISGSVTNNGSGNTLITNNGKDGITVTSTGNVKNGTGNLTLTNTGLGDTKIAGTLINITGNLTVSNKNTEASGIFVSGIVINNNGDLTISNNGQKGITISGITNNTTGNTGITNAIGSAGGINISGKVDNKSGKTAITNNGAGGITVSGTVNNSAGKSYIDIEITNAIDTGIKVTSTGKVANSGTGNTKVTNNGTGGITVDKGGFISNGTGNLLLTNTGLGDTTIAGSLINNTGNTTIENTNTGKSGITITSTGTVTNKKGLLGISNAGTKGITIAGTITNNETGNSTYNTEITNKAGSEGGINISGSVTNNGSGNTLITNNGKDGITVTSTGNVKNGTGNLTLTNTGLGDTKIAGTLINITGNLTVSNKNTEASGIFVSGIVINNNGDLNVINKGTNGITISGITNNTTGNTSIFNSNEGESGITITTTGIVTNRNGDLKGYNAGKNGILIAGNTVNKNGNTEITNVNTSANAGIVLENTGRITNTAGNIFTSNAGGKGTVVKGLIKTLTNGSITIDNKDSNVTIGDDSSLNNDFYVTANNGDVTINNTNGNVLNSGVDKTLVKTDKNLIITVTDGNIGSVDYTNPSNPGFGIETKTRDARESFNINVAGTVTATAKNKNNSNDTLINLRSKDSDMNLNQIKADGNILLTAVDWADSSNDSGYSIFNAGVDGVANIEGKNISLIASKNIGEEHKWLTFNQTYNPAKNTGTVSNAWLSAESEKDLYIKALSDEYNANLWEMIAKTGNMGLELSGNTTIREITAGGNLKIVNKGANLTIYDLGKLSHMLNTEDDILYPHDHIAIGSVSPSSLDLEVLDINKNTRIDPLNANSVLNIYNAYVKGLNNNEQGKNDEVADIVLRADNVFANAYEAASSPVSTKDYRYGYNAKEGRSYTDNPFDPTTQTIHATGFHSIGDGNSLVFDIQGVSPDLVTAIGRNINERNYYIQPVLKTIPAFTNKYYKPDVKYKAKNVTLSVNSNNTVQPENFSVIVKHLYADNAYIDTKNINLNFEDAIINNYAEFRNGNGKDEYKWLTVVDNDYRRLIHTHYGLPVTLQLYTALTGSFNLSMGRLIVLYTNAPAVYYDPYHAKIMFNTENSFYRLTYKDDKIQKTTTTPAFKDIDKSTYKPVQRTAIRFNVKDSNSNELVSSSSGVVSVLDISRTGLLVKQDGTLKVGDKFKVKLKLDNFLTEVDVQVVRVNKSSKVAGVKFVNLDKATENKILYMNLMKISQKSKAKNLASIQ